MAFKFKPSTEAFDNACAQLKRRNVSYRIMSKDETDRISSLEVKINSTPISRDMSQEAFNELMSLYKQLFPFFLGVG